jgi:membrane protease YdiL (CAAX protease family)
MNLRNGTYEPGVDTVRPWSLSAALITGAAGLIAFFLSFALLTTFGMMALSTQLSSGEADAVVVIVTSIVTGVVGYIFARMFVVSGVYGFFRSIAWRASATQVFSCMAVGTCATFLVRLFITGTLKGTTIHSAPEQRLLVLVLLGTVLIEPFIEEIYFRGILFAGLTRRFGPIWSICIVTVLFVLGHPQHYWIVLPISIILAITRLGTGSTANCFALHAAYNLGIVLWGIR